MTRENGEAEANNASNTEKPSAEVQHAVYRRLLAGDAGGPNLLARHFFPSLDSALRAKFADVPDQAMVTSIALATLADFPRKLGKYDAARGALWSYLYTDAQGDVLNALRSERSKAQKLPTVSLDAGPSLGSGAVAGVADFEKDRNVNVEAEVIESMHPRVLDLLPPEVTLDEIRAKVADIVKNPEDEALLTLMLEGEKRTSAFAAALGIESLPEADQQKTVKQHKDRLHKRLTRLRKELS